MNAHSYTAKVAKLRKLLKLALWSWERTAMRRPMKEWREARKEISAIRKEAQ